MLSKQILKSPFLASLWVSLIIADGNNSFNMINVCDSPSIPFLVELEFINFFLLLASINFW